MPCIFCIEFENSKTAGVSSGGFAVFIIQYPVLCDMPFISEMTQS